MYGRLSKIVKLGKARNPNPGFCWQIGLGTRVAVQFGG
jgi:hypothetical protein